MYAIIVAPSREEQVQAVVQKLGDIVFLESEKMDSSGIKSAFHSLSRVMADTLILDVDAAPGKDLVDAVKGYRIARPQTRIVLLAPGREPGDDTIARLVGLGIYDIKSGNEESDWAQLLDEILQTPPATFAAAARWHMSYDREPKNEQLVIERHPIGTVTISVAGAAQGIGCTHTALAIASHVASKNIKVALLEFCQRPSLHYLANVLNVRGDETPGKYRMGNLHIFPIGPDVGPEELERTYYQKQQQVYGKYEYVVVDLGELNRSKLSDFSRSSLAVTVASGAPWRWLDLLSVLSLCGEEDNVSFVFAAPSEKNFKRLIKEAGIETACLLPYIPDPLRPAEADEILQKLLAGILPDNIGRKGLSFKLFKR
ncbi:MAG: hypothetical protein FH756_17455 [Firmicutes bacterium]|nr:hypothetical protein [Bacillota bacterium]